MKIYMNNQIVGCVNVDNRLVANEIIDEVINCSSYLLLEFLSSIFVCGYHKISYFCFMVSCLCVKQSIIVEAIIYRIKITMCKRLYIFLLFLLILGSGQLFFGQTPQVQDKAIIHGAIKMLEASDSSVYRITPTHDSLSSSTITPNRGIKSYKVNLLSKTDYACQSKVIKFNTLYHKPNWQADSALQFPVDFPTPTPAAPPRSKDEAIIDIKYLDMNQGLSSSYVFTSIIDKNGFLWLGTFNGGLVRYNGHSFVNFTMEHGLPDNSVRSLLEDSKGRLWIGTPGSGVCIYDGHSIVKLPDTLMLRQLYVFDIKEDASGVIWMSTMKNGLFKITDDAIMQMQIEPWLKDKQIYTVFPNSSGAWLGSDSTFFRLRRDTLTQYVFENDSIAEGIKTFFQLSDNEMFLGGSFSLLYLNGDSLYEIQEDGKSITKNKTIVQDGAQNFWIGTTNSGVYKLKFDFKNMTEASTRCYRMNHGLSQDYVTSLSVLGNALWITTFEGGINKFVINSFEHITIKLGLNSDLVWAFAEDENNHLWMGSEKSGIVHSDGKNFAHYERPLLHSHIVLSGMADSNKNLWFGTYKGGLYKIVDSTLFYYALIPNQKAVSVTSMLQSKSGDFWFGTWSHGLFKYDGRQVTRYYNSKELGKHAIFSIVEDLDGNIWIATEGNGVYKMTGGKLINYNIDNILPNNDIYTIKQLKDSSMWIGTSGSGLVILKDDNILRITSEDGLSSSIVSSIIQDKKDRVWVGTEKGLNLIQYKDNVKFKAHSGQDFAITTYSNSDGLRGVDFYNNSAYIDFENRIWWGTGKCVTSLDLDELQMPEDQGRVIIDALQVNQQWIDFHSWAKESERLRKVSPIWEGVVIDEPNKFLNTSKYIELPYGLRHVTFHFCITKWSNPYKVQYYTRLYPIETEWSLGSSEPKAEYRNISPGKYKFEVYAVDPMGNKSTVASQSVVVKPPWWLTWWAYSIYIITALIILALAHHGRTRILKQRQKELENTVKERTIEVQEKNEELRSLVNKVSDQRNELEVQRNTVIKQRDELKQTNLSISQSIDYAKRIQSALLTENSLLTSVFPKSFLFFRPRDIVSGDFYWWAKVKNVFIVVVADCTGHGVPGAFMSMLGITLLREIVLKEHELQPDEILNKLRSEIIQILKQKQKPGEQRDGLDMSLIKYDLMSKELFFAGAHHSLLMNNGKEVVEIKGDRLPIAIYPKMKPFASQQIKYKPGDRIYMFSDGFLDQFGGSKNTKIKKSGFVNLITQYTHIDMQEQDALLSAFLEEWQGSTDRLDDILILGFELPE